MLVSEALASGLDVVEVYAEPEADEAVLRSIQGTGIDLFLVEAGALGSVLDTVASRAIAAVVRQPAHSASDLASDAPVLVLAGLSDPGNVGTLIRTAEAAGFAGIVLAGDAVDPFNPKVVRAAAGALFRLPVLSLAWDEATTMLRDDGRPVVATVVADGADYDTVDLRRAAIVLGNEAHGLDPAQAADADLRITIPMAGPTESLNVAAAGAILCFASWQQRRHDSTPVTQMVGQRDPDPSGSS